jgi:menaquinone-dependent protoporphyrinogen oxidase
MATDILVAFATKHGSTQEVAEAVVEELNSQGLEVELRTLDEVKDLDGYGSVVLGAPLYMGRWHQDARRFLKRRRGELAELPVAVFALGPLKNTEAEIRGAREQLDKALHAVPELRPATVAVFGGVIDPAKLSFPFNHMPAGDARDWDAIRAWARSLPAELGRTGRERDGDRAGSAVPEDGELDLVAGMAAVDQGP